MAKVIGKLIDGLSKIPGMAWVIAVVAYVYLQATGLELEGSWTRMLVVTLACALVYWLASVLDYPYALLYDADRGHKRWLPLLPQLDRERSEAAKSFFSFDTRVTNYDKAVEHQYITKDKTKPGLYAYAKALAKQSEDWEGAVTLALDLSKASRTLSLAAAIVATGLWLQWIQLPTALAGAWWLRPRWLLLDAAVLLVSGFLLRAWHQIALYRKVRTNTAHATLMEGRFFLVPAKLALTKSGGA